jgi:hypothetical protein
VNWLDDVKFDHNGHLINAQNIDPIAANFMNQRQYSSSSAKAAASIVASTNAIDRLPNLASSLATTTTTATSSSSNPTIVNTAAGIIDPLKTAAAASTTTTTAGKKRSFPTKFALPLLFTGLGFAVGYLYKSMN